MPNEFSPMSGHRGTDKNSVVVIPSRKAITRDDGQFGIRSDVNRRLFQRHIRLILDLTKTEAIDTDGIQELINSREKAKKKGGDLLLANAYGTVLEQLTKTEYSSSLALYSSITEAKAEFKHQEVS